MAEPIKESKEKKSARQKGMEAWAASIAARQQTPENQLPEQEGVGGAYRPNSAQRPKNIKTVTKTQKTHETRKKDSVDLARTAEKSEAELTMKDVRSVMAGRVKTGGEVGTPSNVQSTAPPVTAQKTPEVKAEKAIEEAAQDSVAEAAETVTAEEVQAAPAVMTTVAAKSTKKSGKAEATEETSKTAEAEEAEEEVDVASLIKPGNDPKASAYVRAGDLMPGGSSDPDIDDYMLAL